MSSVPRGSGIVAGTSQYLLRYPTNSTVDSFLEEVRSRPSGPSAFCHMHFTAQIRSDKDEVMPLSGHTCSPGLL